MPSTKDRKTAVPKFRLLKQTHVHNRVVVIPLPDEKCREYRYRNAEKRRDEVRGEPIVFLALIQHHLQAAEADDNQTEADVVDSNSRLLLFFQPWRIFH